jgi:hypothetical protein
MFRGIILRGESDNLGKLFSDNFFRSLQMVFAVTLNRI